MDLLLNQEVLKKEKMYLELKYLLGSEIESKLTKELVEFSEHLSDEEATNVRKEILVDINSKLTYICTDNLVKFTVDNKIFTFDLSKITYKNIPKEVSKIIDECVEILVNPQKFKYKIQFSIDVRKKLYTEMLNKEFSNTSVFIRNLQITNCVKENIMIKIIFNLNGKSEELLFSMSHNEKFEDSLENLSDFIENL